MAFFGEFIPEMELEKTPPLNVGYWRQLQRPARREAGASPPFMLIRMGRFFKFVPTDKRYNLSQFPPPSFSRSCQRPRQYGNLPDPYEYV
jgi:hypothetical protein